MAVDPACGMEVDPANPGATMQYEGETYYFCSEGCRERFAAAPDRYVGDQLPDLSELEGVTTPRVVSGRTRGEFELTVHGDELGVGDEVRFTRRVTDEDVRKFAEVTGDMNALHLNEAFAGATRFGRRIVHGTLVAGLISAALASFPGITIYRDQTLSFERPVDIDETLVATCRIVDELKEDTYYLVTRVETDGGEVVLHGTATVLIDDMPALPAGE